MCNTDTEMYTVVIMYNAALILQSELYKVISQSLRLVSSEVLFIVVVKNKHFQPFYFSFLLSEIRMRSSHLIFL